MLLFDNDKVHKPYEDVCGRNIIRMGYFDHEYFFRLHESNNSMVEFPYTDSLGYYPKPHEILSTFFKSQNVRPTWFDFKSDYGTFNKTSGTWTGAVADVSDITNHFLNLCAIKKG